MIILLNGATSSGKTTIARAIQHLDNRAWLTLGIDTMIQMMPAHYLAGGEKADQGFNFIPSEDEYGPTMSLQTGHFGHKICNSIPEIALLLSRKGFDVIVDDVLIGDENLKCYVRYLSDFKVYFVGVHCNRQILEEHEILRGDRFVGSGRDQLRRCHGPTRCYDLEVDTSHRSSFECAKKILEYVTNEPEPQGFKTLNKLL